MSILQSMTTFLRTLALPCREQVMVATRAEEGAACRAERAALRVHTLYCRGCRRFRAQVRTLRTLAASLGRGNDESPLPPEVRARLTERLKDAADRGRSDA
jgi:hypothetical protein